MPTSAIDDDDNSWAFMSCVEEEKKSFNLEENFKCNTDLLDVSGTHTLNKEMENMHGYEAREV